MLLSLLLVACGSKPQWVRSAPAEALSGAATRLQDRGIKLKRLPLQQLQSDWYCYQPPKVHEQGWDRNFSLRRAPLPFSHSGALKEQERLKVSCPYLFRFQVLARQQEGGTELHVESEWWRLSSEGCETQGDPILGIYDCRYNWRGCQAPEDLRSFVYGILAGL